MPPEEQFQSRIIFAVVIAVCVALWLFATAFVVNAHEARTVAGQPLGWKYSYACCSDKDCRPVAAGEIRETPEGYLLIKTGEVVGYQDKRVKESPDGTFHVCQVAGDFEAGRILCIYAPPRSF